MLQRSPRDTAAGVSAAPPVVLPAEFRERLESQRAGLADAFQGQLTARVRPCIAVTAERVGPAPLRPGVLASLFGKKGAAPVLPVTASKFGGTPYAVADEDWAGRRFIGQIDLAEATAVLPPGAPRLTGLLRLDIGTEGATGFRVRWFPSPSPERVVAVSVESIGAWETRLKFALQWSLPQGERLEAIWPDPEAAWYDHGDWCPEGFNTDGFDEYHRLLGHLSSGVDEPYELEGPEGYEQLLRLTYDNEADFAWGTNWVYVLVPEADLPRADLSRIVVTSANS